MRPGDKLIGHDNQLATVDELIDTKQWQTVYNFLVADSYTYFVGCQQWGFSVWVYNACIVELTDAAEIAANGGNRFKIVEGSKTIGSHADRVSAEKWLDLASDPAVGKLRPDEAATALRLEQGQGVTLKRYNPPAGKKGDWVDGSGVVYDGVSPAPSAHFARQFDNWKGNRSSDFTERRGGLAVAVGGDALAEVFQRVTLLESERLHHRQDTLHEAAPRRTRTPERAASPEHGTT